MATPPNKATANTDSTANKATIVSAADQLFIDDAAIAINNAIALGNFHVYLQLPHRADMQTLQTYFEGLGYDFDVWPPPSIFLPGPAEFFGEIWTNFWTKGGIFNPNNSKRIKIGWKP
jgi:hypothetical protein